MKKDNEKLELALNNSFKEIFNKKSLNEDFYERLEKRIKDEKIIEKSLKGKLDKFLNREIEVDVRSIIAVAVVLFSLPTLFSLKEVDSNYREKIQLSKVIKNKMDNK